MIDEGPFTRCPNRFRCPSQLKRALEHLASEAAFDIPGMGEATASGLVDRGLVKTPTDLFRLTAPDLLHLEGFAERSACKLAQAIADRRRTIELHRFLVALGIPSIGVAAARELATRMTSLDAVRHASVAALRDRGGLGPHAAEAVHRFFHERVTQQLVDGLLRAGVTVERSKVTADGKLRGKRFVFTGALASLSRARAGTLVEQRGGHVATSVGRHTDFVVAGDRPGTKLAQARSLGVPVITEAAFLRLVRPTQ